MTVKELEQEIKNLKSELLMLSARQITMITNIRFLEQNRDVKLESNVYWSLVEIVLNQLKHHFKYELTPYVEYEERFKKQIEELKCFKAEILKIVR